MRLSYEELAAKFAATKAELIETKELLKKALKEIEFLKEKLNKNSKNSSKPPSTDQKKNTLDNHRKIRQKRKGIHRPFFSKEEIDEKVTCSLENCPHCNSRSIKDLSTFDTLQPLYTTKNNLMKTTH